jgi:L-threonylcarbamoyladenylate synthase
LIASKSLHHRVDAAVELLKKGGVAAVPTDTFYGLAACALDARAVGAVFRLKRRPEGEPLPVLMADASDLTGLALHVPDLAWDLASAFWPGALTVVVKKASGVPDAVSGGSDTVGLRVPDHWVPRAIARGLGAPITGTSANRSGGADLTEAAAVHAEFGGELPLVVDAGRTPGGLPSTVVDLAGETPRILRSGAVSQVDLERVCGELVPLPG